MLFPRNYNTHQCSQGPADMSLVQLTVGLSYLHDHMSPIKGLWEGRLSTSLIIKVYWLSQFHYRLTSVLEPKGGGGGGGGHLRFVDDKFSTLNPGQASVQPSTQEITNHQKRLFLNNHDMSVNPEW